MFPVLQPDGQRAFLLANFSCLYCSMHAWICQKRARDAHVPSPLLIAVVEASNRYHHLAWSKIEPPHWKQLEVWGGGVCQGAKAAQKPRVTKLRAAMKRTSFFVSEFFSPPRRDRLGHFHPLPDRWRCSTVRGPRSRTCASRPGSAGRLGQEGKREPRPAWLWAEQLHVGIMLRGRRLWGSVLPGRQVWGGLE